ncbi:MAG: N-acetyl-gamma-glutamyl-phosphate reductase [Gammaproteobacteria bacterium]|nr:N-acetyl-gamma-glutamyl-phosphate reductase [Gammaproteobacteria bacterium]
MIEAGIVGGTGYTGVELLRLLSGHDQVNIKVITSRAEAGKPVSDLYPNLRGHVDIPFSEPDIGVLRECDVVFFATPNGIAMTMAAELLEAGVKVIDLAADFRLKDIDEWQQWYGMEHACPDLVAKAVYGLPEVNRASIREAQLVANPGCYPTATQLGFLPLIENGLVDTGTLVADCKSGVSGAGRGANVGTLFCEAGDSLKAYAVSGHRHLPEITQGLTEATDDIINLTFVPHLTPMIRGIHATLYARAKADVADLQLLYEQRYADEPFVDVLPADSHPDTRSVRSSNVCRIAVHASPRDNMIIVLSVIDNLVKGAAGQAVQNMNLMFDLPETSGLLRAALLP